MKLYCIKHPNHNGFPNPCLMTPIGQTDGIIQVYCPKCDSYYYTKDGKTFALTRDELS
jgi:hypothetical protein